MKRGVLGLVVVTALQISAAPASGQSLNVPVGVFAAAAAADWASTAYIFSRDRRALQVHEDNPLINGLEGRPAAMIAAGAGLDVLYVYGLTRVLQDHPRWVAAVLYGSSAFRLGLAIHNIQQTHQGRR